LFIRLPSPLFLEFFFALSRFSLFPLPSTCRSGQLLFLESDTFKFYSFTQQFFSCYLPLVRVCFLLRFCLMARFFTPSKARLSRAAQLLLSTLCFLFPFPRTRPLEFSSRQPCFSVPLLPLSINPRPFPQSRRRLSCMAAIDSWPPLGPTLSFCRTSTSTL